MHEDIFDRVNGSRERKNVDRNHVGTGGHMTAVENRSLVVVCRSCRKTIIPTKKSVLWWKANKHEKQEKRGGYTCTGEECGCITPIEKPNAPFRVYSYNHDCHDCQTLDIPCDTFIEAVKTYLQRHRNRTLFIKGVSEKVMDAIHSLPF